VLQASQVEVGISRKETESNAGSIGTSQTDSESEGESERESETGVGYGIKRIRSNGSDQQGDRDWRKDAQAQLNKHNTINKIIVCYKPTRN
jgi:hypothetical protein